MGGIQAGLIIGVRQAKARNIEWPAILMAVASAVLLAAGVLRHYIDIYVHRTVRGISFIFVGIDALGDVFSLVSVVFQPTLDILGMAIYGTELVLWIGVFMCGAYYNLVPWLKKKRTGATNGSISPGGAVGVSEEAEGRRSTAVASGIALHDLPSSTSVFRTPSGQFEVTQRSVNGERGQVLNE
jgi:nitrate/nitrite transporter NarK